MNEEEQARYKAILTEHSKLYTENKKLKDKVSYLKERVAYLERSNNRREETILYLREENNELHNKIDKAIEALDGIRKIIETEKRLMGYAIYDSCLLLIEEQLDKAKDLKDSDVNE